MINRRKTLLLGGGAAFVMVGGLLGGRLHGQNGSALAEDFEITRSRDEWKKLLTPEEFAVLREEATERPYSSPLNDEKRDGTFHCAGCDLAAYESDTKFDSGTGWPSFYQAVPEAVGTKADNSLFVTRTEVHCRRCGGHFGHIFDDGPKPTGKRHCLNGVALNFKPASA